MSVMSQSKCKQCGLLNFDYPSRDVPVLTVSQNQMSSVKRRQVAKYLTKQTVHTKKAQQQNESLHSVSVVSV